MRNYVAQKQKQLIEQQSNFYTPTGIHVYFKDQLSNHKVDIERVVNKVENKIPEHLLSNVEMIIIGHFDEFTEREASMLSIETVPSTSHQIKIVMLISMMMLSTRFLTL